MNWLEIAAWVVSGLGALLGLRQLFRRKGLSAAQKHRIEAAKKEVANLRHLRSEFEKKGEAHKELVIKIDQEIEEVKEKAKAELSKVYGMSAEELEAFVKEEPL